MDFEGRASWGVTTISGESDEDENGIGTHIAGTVAGHRYGVAKKANVTAVKVLNASGSGTLSDIVKAVTWINKDHEQKVGKAQASHFTEDFKGSVVALSMGGIATSPSLQKAVNYATADGIHFAVDAGDKREDACGENIHAEQTITVAASTLDDSLLRTSNHGKCVDVLAPGLSVVSTYIGSPYAINALSGTPMAAAHVAGIMAYLISLGKSSPDTVIYPQQLKTDILSIATQGEVSGLPKDTPNVGLTEINSLDGARQLTV